MQVKTTSKLFYKKYPYKVECRVGGASYITRLGITKAMAMCLSDDEIIERHGWRWRVPLDKVKLASFIKCVKKYVNKKEELDIKIRAEGDGFCLFCKDIDLYEEMKFKLDQFIRCVTIPASQEVLTYMLDNGPRKIIVKKIPYDLYKYKISLSTNTPSSVKRNFREWIKRYDSKTFKISGTTKDWLTENKRYWVQSPFFYVQDSSALTMTSLYLGNNIKRIEEFVTVDSIKEA